MHPCCSMSLEVTKRIQIPWNCSYTPLLVAMWVLWIELRSSASAASGLNYWAISPTPHTWKCFSLFIQFLCVSYIIFKSVLIAVIDTSSLAPSCSPLSPLEFTHSIIGASVRWAKLCSSPTPQWQILPWALVSLSLVSLLKKARASLPDQRYLQIFPQPRWGSATHYCSSVLDFCLLSFQGSCACWYQCCRCLWTGSQELVPLGLAPLPWLLQSLHPLFHNVPWALGGWRWI